MGTQKENWSANPVGKNWFIAVSLIIGSAYRTDCSSKSYRLAAIQYLVLFKKMIADICELDFTGEFAVF